MHFSILEDWVDKGRSEALPEEMVRYLEQLTMVNGLWNASNSPSKIIAKLCLAYEELDRIAAKSRMEDAFTFFFLDSNVKQDAYRNMIFEKQLKLADAIIQSATCPDDYNKASLVLERAYKSKGLDKEEADKIPDSAFDKPVKLYMLETSEFKDLPQNTNRNRLAQFIDDMNLTEEDRLRIKQDAGIERKELFIDHEQKEDDQ